MHSDNKKIIENHKNLTIRIIVRVCLVFVFMVLIFFLTAGSIRYREAWIYCITLFIPSSIVITYFLKKDPEFLERRLLKRREKEKEPRKLQDRFTILFLAFFLIPGLDYRFHWSDIPFFIILISDFFVLAGYILIVWVLMVNRFASAIIEIHQDQRIIDTGPYKIVRHPMYTGGLIFIVFTPLALGSWWALIPFLICYPAALVLRIRTEEKFLITRLTGYEEYCRKTKYRLIPYLW